MPARSLLVVSHVFISFALAPQAWAHDPKAQKNDVVTVWGVRDDELGEAFSASEGTIDFSRFVDRPLLRSGELAEVVPGLAATQHSGAGKANQYFLRGFNLDHGTDFSIFMDGVPINLRTHAHGQGYLDINFIIPELVERVRYHKGVYTAEIGDFSAAGSAAFRTFDLLPESFVQAEVGGNNWLRLLSGVNIGDIGYGAIDITQDDGPWVRPEDLNKQAGFLKLKLGDLRLSLTAYDAEWNSTDQAPRRLIEAGLLDPNDDIDQTVGGQSHRVMLNAEYRNDSGLTANAYAVDYALQLFSNFTYFLDDPENGDQFEQAEERQIFGGSVQKVFSSDGPWTFRAGAETRFDDINPIGLFRTTERLRRETVREDSVEQLSAGIYGDASRQFGKARINLGLRGDIMDVDIASDDPRNSGSADDTLLSPKASLAYRFAERVEGYASIGRGFHSNDARGATISVDPASGDPAERVPLLVPGTGGELGLRYGGGDVLATFSLWALELDSELVFVGDAGATEATGSSRRVGFEANGSWRATDWLTLDGSAAWTDAKFTDAPSGEDKVPLAVEYVLTGGANLQFGEAWNMALTLRHLGPAPLIEDGSVESDASTVVNLRAAYAIGDYSIALEALNLFDSNDADITYFYESRLPGEPDGGVADFHQHPIPDRSIRLQVRRNF